MPEYLLAEKVLLRTTWNLCWMHVTSSFPCAPHMLSNNGFAMYFTPS